MLSDPIHETSDDELSEASGLASFGEHRKKHRLNHRAALQFIDSMAADESESNCEQDSEEEDAISTASEDSFIVGDDISDRTY